MAGRGNSMRVRLETVMFLSLQVLIGGEMRSRQGREFSLVRDEVALLTANREEDIASWQKIRTRCFHYCDEEQGTTEFLKKMDDSVSRWC